MKKSLFISAAAMLLAIFSCNKPENNNGGEIPSLGVDFTIDATMQSGSWVAGERLNIVIVDGNGSSRTIEANVGEAGSTASFKASVEKDGIYDITILSTGAIISGTTASITIPVNQKNPVGGAVGGFKSGTVSEQMITLGTTVEMTVTDLVPSQTYYLKSPDNAVDGLNGNEKVSSVALTYSSAVAGDGSINLTTGEFTLGSEAKTTINLNYTGNNMPALGNGTLYASIGASANLESAVATLEGGTEVTLEIASADLKAASRNYVYVKLDESLDDFSGIYLWGSGERYPYWVDGGHSPVTGSSCGLNFAKCYVGFTGTEERPLIKNTYDPTAGDDIISDTRLDFEVKIAKLAENSIPDPSGVEAIKSNVYEYMFYGVKTGFRITRNTGGNGAVSILNNDYNLTVNVGYRFEFGQNSDGQNVLNMYFYADGATAETVVCYQTLKETGGNGGLIEEGSDLTQRTGVWCHVGYTPYNATTGIGKGHLVLYRLADYTVSE